MTILFSKIFSHKRLHRGGTYWLEIPVKYCLHGQEKIVQWLNEKLEMVKKELKCKISKSLKNLANHLLCSFSLGAKINSKLLIVFANCREKALNRPFRAENSVSWTECPRITFPYLENFLWEFDQKFAGKKKTIR